MLPKENKEEFHDEVDITDEKAKLRVIMEKSPFLIEIMKHEEHLREIFEINFFLNFFVSNKYLWNDISFVIILIQNFVILTSYTSKF